MSLCVSACLCVCVVERWLCVAGAAILLLQSQEEGEDLCVACVRACVRACLPACARMAANRVSHLLVASQLKGFESAKGMADSLIAYVREWYGEESASDAEEDIQEVCRLRESIRGFSNRLADGAAAGAAATAGTEDASVSRILMQDSNAAQDTDACLADERLAACVRYYRCVTLMESRFPLGVRMDRAETKDKKDHLKKVSFCWWDSYRPSKRCTQQSFLLEKAGILFNAGALAMQRGLGERARLLEPSVGNGATAAGAASTDPSITCIKVACKSFQTAAGYYRFLKENIVPRLISGQGAFSNGSGSGVLSSLSNTSSQTTVDLSRESCNMLELLCLAQAQECFYELALKGGKANTTVSKIARYSGLLYSDAHAIATAAPLSGHVDRNWAAYLLAKGKLFDCISYRHLAADARANDKIGEEIVRLQSAEACIRDALQFRRILNAALAQALVEFEQDIQRDFKRAHRENDTVYLTRIPAADSLPPPGSVVMVKADVDGVVELLDAKSLKLFEKLVPDASAKALSKYTEMVDELVRSELAKLENESDNARVKLREYELPDVLFSIEGSGGGALPPPLAEQIDSLEMDGGPSQLSDLLGQIDALSGLNREMVESIKRTLDEEESADAAMRGQFEARWTTSESRQLNKGLRDKLHEYESGCSAAAASDAKLRARHGDLEPLFRGLTRGAMSARVPVLKNPLMTSNVASRLKDVVVELQKLGVEREAVEEELKGAKSADNILPLIMATTQSYDSLFADELKTKYAPAQAKVSALVARQAKLIAEMDRLFADFQREYELPAWRQSCRAFEEEGCEVIKTFEQMKGNLKEGLRFHTTQQDVIAALQQQCEDFSATRRIQRNELVERIQTHALQAYAARQHEQQGQADMNASFAQMNVTGGQPPAPHAQQMRQQELAQHRAAPPPVPAPQQPQHNVAPPMPQQPQQHAASPQPPPQASHHPPPDQAGQQQQFYHQQHMQQPEQPGQSHMYHQHQQCAMPPQPMPTAPPPQPSALQYGHHPGQPHPQQGYYYQQHPPPPLPPHLPPPPPQQQQHQGYQHQYGGGHPQYQYAQQQQQPQ